MGRQGCSGGMQMPGGTDMHDMHSETTPEHLPAHGLLSEKKRLRRALFVSRSVCTFRAYVITNMYYNQYVL